MATNIGTQQDSPKAPWWAELREWFTSFFKRPSENEGLTKQNASADTAETNESEGVSKPSGSENPTEPSPPTTDTPSSAQPADSEPMPEIKAALQRIEEALSALPRIEEALLRLPTTPTSPANPTVASPPPSPTPEHHAGDILLAFLDAGDSRFRWLHSLLESQVETAKEHASGARLIADKLAERYQATNPDIAEALRHWAQHGEPEPPDARLKRRRDRQGRAVS